MTEKPNGRETISVKNSNNSLLPCESALLELIRASVKNENIKSLSMPADWNKIYELCRKHSVLATTFPAFDKIYEKKNKTNKLYMCWREAFYKSQVREIAFDAENESICAELNSCGIKYLPVKGIKLKQLYPCVGMRTFADFDYLIAADRAGKVKNIMTEHGFETVQFNTGSHDVYVKKPFYNFEMHRDLADPVSPYFEYFSHTWERARQCEGSCYTINDNDFYIHFVAHAARHYKERGIGLRVLADNYLFCEKFRSCLDGKYISTELKKLQLSDFAYNLNSLSDKIFSGNSDGSKSFSSLDKNESEMLHRLIASGTYGNSKTHMQALFEKSADNKNELARNKRKYLFKRIFPKKELMEIRYPVLKTFPVLYPFCAAARIAGAVTHSKRLKNEVTAVRSYAKKDK